MTAAAKKSSGKIYASALSRSCAALLGGYMASFALVFSMARILVRFGISRADAAAAPAIASFLIWLALALYAFGARSAWRAWLLPFVLMVLFGSVAALLGKPQLSVPLVELPR